MTARDVIAQALALSEAASKGPWGATTDDHGRGRPLEHSVWAGDANGSYVAESIATRGDAELFAAARTLLPALAKALGDVLDLHEAHEAPLVRADRAGRCQCVACDMGRAITAALSEVTP